jgi:hypothetical protein
VVQVFSVVTGSNKCVSYVGKLLEILANQSYGRDKWGGVSGNPMMRVFQRQTFSLLALIDDQVDG